MPYTIEAYNDDEKAGKIGPAAPSASGKDTGSKDPSSPPQTPLESEHVKQFISSLLSDFDIFPDRIDVLNARLNELRNDLKHASKNMSRKLLKDIDNIIKKSKRIGCRLDSFYIELASGSILIPMKTAPAGTTRGELNLSQRKDIVWNLLCAIDDYMGDVSFRLMFDGKPTRENFSTAAAPTQAPAAAAAPASGDTKEKDDKSARTVLQYLRRASAFAEALDYTPAQNEEIRNSLKTSSFSHVLGTKDWFQGWPNIFRTVYLQKGNIAFSGNTTIPKEITSFFTAINKDGRKAEDGKTFAFRIDENIHVLWIPKKLSPYFFSEDGDGRVFSGETGSLVGRPLSKSDCVYYIENDKLQSFEFQATAASSRGGGGAMRSDRPSEAIDYRWAVREKASVDRGRDFGISIGLDAGKQFSDEDKKEDWKDYQVTTLPYKADMRTPTAGSMDSEIVYWKKFPETPRIDKKNKPREDKPASARPLSRVDAQSLYTKKQKGKAYTAGDKEKGEANATGTSPIAIGGPVGMRLSASQVMKKSVIFGDGSATAFAEKVLEDNAEARQSLFAPESKTTRLRTDQEWCHLIGHGDGGKEVPENFVSGSNHCNTEQLAIETGQRTGRATYKIATSDEKHEKAVELAVKVTAYLVPNSPVDRKSDLHADEKKFLEKLKIIDKPSPKKARSKATPVSESLRTKIKEFIQNNKGKKIVGNSGTELSEKESKRYIQNLKEMLYETPLPLANFVRYKIFVKYTNDEKKIKYAKIFDHTYDAQKESFDLFEYKIIEGTVRRVIAAYSGREDAYRNEISLKLKKLASQKAPAPDRPTRRPQR